MLVQKILNRVRLKAYTFRSQLGQQAFGSKHLYEPGKVYLIDPQRIKVSLDHPGAEGLPDEKGWTRSPLYDSGRVIGGDWDLNTIPFEDMDVWQAFYHRFREGGRWEETAFFARNEQLIGSGREVWGCASRDDLTSRLRGVDALFDRIKTSGYRQRSELSNEYDTWFSEVDDVRVHIGRSGDYIFGDGRHRLCIARLLDLRRIPVRVCRRHKDWVGFRKEILNYAARHGSKVYAPLTHPDLNDVPSHHGNRRAEILKSAIPGSSGRFLDIGAHWGYFCHLFEERGYECTGIEYNPINARFMRRLRRAEDRQFEVHEGSALEFRCRETYDVVLALNIFHHFIKTASDHAKLENLLGSLPTRLLVFEPHLVNDPQMKNSYRNYTEAEFVGWVRECGRFNSARRIGVAEDGRPLFLLAR